MGTPLANCDQCGVGITLITYRINCGYCKRCGGVSPDAYHLPKESLGPADVAAVTAELDRRQDRLLQQHWQRVQARQQAGDELLAFRAHEPKGSSVVTHYGVLWRRGEEQLSVLTLDKETRKWREAEALSLIA